MRLTGTVPGPAATLWFDGNAIPALAGESVAAALAAAGVLALRRTEAGAARGVWCGMGACWDCLVMVDGAPVRACMTPVADGLHVDPAPPLPPAAQLVAPGPPWPDRDCDVLVAGAGPAGLSAALAAAEAGASVLMLDERSAPGGQYYKPLAASHAALRPDRQHRRGAALRRAAAAAGVEVLAAAAVWGAFGANEVAVVLRGRTLLVRPRRLILAPGAFERPVPVPGWTLPGVMTTGAMQGLARSYRVSPGVNVVVAGNGPLNLQLACELLAGGARVAAVVEAAQRPGIQAWRAATRLAVAAPDLAAAGALQLRTLRRAGVPVLWGTAVLACEGEGRFERLRVLTPAGERSIAAEACALNMGFVPETGLARALGATHRASIRSPGALDTVTDGDGRTSAAGVFAVGDGAALGGARVALAAGRLAGAAAARDLGFVPRPVHGARRAVLRAHRFQDALWTLFRAPPPGPIEDDTVVCRCESVTAGRIRACGGSLPMVKRATRAGMGRCQGRLCGTTLHALCGTPDEAGHAAPRAPLRPVRAAALMEDAPWDGAPVALPPPTRWLSAAQAANPGDCDVLVIGGGVVGLCAALYLAEEGRDVVLADRNEPGLAASTANAGSLHVQLLAHDFAATDPGPLGEALALGPRSIALWRALAQRAGETLGIRTEGGLMLAESEADLVWMRRKVAFERARGIATEVLGPSDLARVAPALDHRYAGAAYCLDEGQIDPLRGTVALLALAQRAGVRVVPGLDVLGLARDGSGWQAETSAGMVRAGAVLNAAGPHAAAVARLAGVALPVRGVVQQVIATAPVAPLLRQLVAVARQHLSLKQGDGGHLLIGGGWPGRLGTDGATRLDRRSIQANLWTAGRVLPALGGIDVVRAWTGLAVHLDRGPVISATPGQPGLFHAVTANGYTLGPVAGRLAADAVMGRGAPPPFALGSDSTT